MPGSATPSQGYIHAPSPVHATTAAISRAARLTAASRAAIPSPSISPPSASGRQPPHRWRPPRTTPACAARLRPGAALHDAQLSRYVAAFRKLAPWSPRRRRTNRSARPPPQTTSCMASSSSLVEDQGAAVSGASHAGQRRRLHGHRPFLRQARRHGGCPWRHARRQQCASGGPGQFQPHRPHLDAVLRGEPIPIRRSSTRLARQRPLASRI